MVKSLEVKCFGKLYLKKMWERYLKEYVVIIVRK